MGLGVIYFQLAKAYIKTRLITYMIVSIDMMSEKNLPSVCVCVGGEGGEIIYVFFV